MLYLTVDVKDIGADFYISNCHKWMNSPKGTTILCVDKKWQTITRPTVISSYGEYYNEEWHRNFEFTGTRDNTNFLAIKEALEFRMEIGDQRIKKYIHDIAWASAKELSTLWKTRILVSNEAMNPALVCIEIPCNLETGRKVQDVLYSKYDTVIILLQTRDISYIRISGQIYLEVQDFVTMATRFLEILETLTKK